MGQKFAVVDGDGRSIAFYDDDVQSTIPPEAFAISDGIWQEWIANPSTRRWSGNQLTTWKDTKDHTVEVLVGRIKSEMEERRGPDDRANLSHARAHAQDREDDGDPVDFKVTLHNGLVVRIQSAAQARGLAKQASNRAAHYENLAAGMIENVQGMTDNQREQYDPLANSHWPAP